MARREKLKRLSHYLTLAATGHLMLLRSDVAGARCECCGRAGSLDRMSCFAIEEALEVGVRTGALTRGERITLWRDYCAGRVALGFREFCHEVAAMDMAYRHDDPEVVKDAAFTLSQLVRLAWLHHCVKAFRSRGN